MSATKPQEQKGEKKRIRETDLLFLQEHKDVVAIANDGHLLFQHRFQHRKPIADLRMQERGLDNKMITENDRQTEKRRRETNLQD